MGLKFPKLPKLKKRKLKKEQRVEESCSHEDKILQRKGWLIDIVLILLVGLILVSIGAFGYEEVTGVPVTLPESSTPLSTAVKEILQIAVDLLK